MKLAIERVLAESENYIIANSFETVFLQFKNFKEKLL